MRFPDGEEKDLGVSRSSQVLALLLYHQGEFLARRTVLEEIWERDEDERPADEVDLSPVLSKLRDRIDELGIEGLRLTEDSSLRIDLPPDVEVDFLRVESDFETLEATDDPEEEWARARRVIDSLGDSMLRKARPTPFLEGRQAHHEDMRYRAQLTTVRLARQMADEPRRAMARRDAERAIASFPDDEAPRVGLIDLHLADGALGNAQRALDALEEKLGDDAASLGDLREKLTRHRWREEHAEMPLVLPVAEEEEEPSAFVGRDGDLESLESILSRVIAGNYASVTLVGDKGVGKSRLARELGRAAHRQGCAVLGASALRDASRDDPPCKPFITVASAWIGSFGVDSLTDVKPVDLAELGRHAPELGEYAELGEADRGLGAGQRLRGALLRTLTGIAKLVPIVVLIDDVQEADEHALRLLRELSEIRPGGLLLLTTGPGYAARLSPSLVRVAPLPPDEARTLAAAVGVEPADELDLDRYGSHDGGNPFLIVNQTELHRIETDFVLPQVERAGPSGRAVLRLAALLGPRFELGVLRNATDDDVDLVISLAEDKKLVRPTGEVGTFEFSHSLIRDSILDGLPSLERSEMSQHLVEALGSAQESAVVRLRLLQEVATFWPEVAERAAIAALEAGDHAAGQPNYEAASTRYKEGLELIGGQDPRLRGRLLVGLGHSLWGSGEFGVARKRFQEAISIEELPPTVRAEAVLGFGGRLGFAGATTDRPYMGMLHNALTDLPASHGDLRLRLLAALAGALAFSAQTDAEKKERGTLCAEALAGAEGAPAKVAAEVLSDVCWTAWDPDRPQARRDLAERFVEVADESLDTSVRIEARIFRIASSLEDGEMGAVWRDLSSCEEFARRSGQPHFEALIALLNGMRTLLAGDPDLAAEHARLALTRGGREKNPAIFELYGAQILLVRLLQGRVDKIRAAAEAMAGAFPGLPGLRAGLGLIYAELGWTKDAQRQLDLIADQSFEGVPRDVFWLVTIEHAARLAVALEDRQRCERLYEMLRPFAGRITVAGGAVGVYGATDRALGLLADALGEHQEAERHLRDAIAINERIGATAINAFATRELASTLSRNGGRKQEIEELLEKSAGIASSSNVTLEPAGVVSEPPGSASPPGRLGPLKQRGAEELSHYLHRLIEDRPDEWIEQWVPGSRVLRRVMPTAFVPSAACGWTGTIELEFKPAIGFRTKNPYWTFEIGEKRARIYSKRARSADLQMTMSPATFFRLVAGDINPVETWLDGRAEILRGDPAVAARLIEMFSGPTQIPELENNE